MVVKTHTNGAKARSVEVVTLTDITVRFCGDSGDGMQLAGTQMTSTSAAFGNDVVTFPDFPSEIRAPTGTLAGVSGFQLHFGARKLRTPGDRVNALIAMNPAALKTNLSDLEPGGILIVNEGAFTRGNLTKAGYDENPLDTSAVSGCKLFKVPMDKLIAEACADTGLSARAIGRCRNFCALGVVYWLYGRPMESTLRWVEQKFGAKPAVADANTKALKAGFYFGETAEMFAVKYEVPPAKLAKGTYRRITGNEAAALGLIAAANQVGKPLFYGSYPITPASDILHELAKHKEFDVRTFQAEDEIAAMTSVIGASFAGALAVTGTSGPGMALKAEGLGLAVIAELPMVIVNVQRGGPSTGLPTKTEQADLFQAIYGRNGEAPLCVLAPATPADCFNVCIEAVRIALEFMTPVIVLSDGYLANGAEPWLVPKSCDLPKMSVSHPGPYAEGFQPYARDEKLARTWGLPGTPGLQHRIGGLEKRDGSGEVCYEPDNHAHMVQLRQKKIDGIAATLPPAEVFGDEQGELLVVGWGSTYGAITSAVERCRAKGLSVSSVHLRHIEPMAPNLGDILKRYERVMVAEMNQGQLITRLRATYLIDAIGYHKVQGKPMLVSEIGREIETLLNGKKS